MKVTDILDKNGILFLDGATGTALIELGLNAGERSEEWNISHKREIESVHAAYFAAGADVVLTNTFGVNAFRYDDEKIDEIVSAAVACAKSAACRYADIKPRFVALDVGPTGKMLAPFGDMTFEAAVNSFKKVIFAGARAGADLVFIETFSDLAETKAAVIAAKETCALPVFVSNAYGEDGKLLSGTTPEAAVCMLEGLGVDAIGCNCSFGPKALSAVAERLISAANVPVIFKPNADLPKDVDGKTVYGVTIEEFADEVAAVADKGARIIGGCCGTTPKYLEKVVEVLSQKRLEREKHAYKSVISSFSHTVELGNTPVVIGERINPTGKKQLKAAITAGDHSFVMEEAVKQKKAGAHILDVNVGVVGVDEKKVLKETVFRLLSVTDLPLCIDSSDTSALEAAIRIYAGKPLVNSVSGKRESMDGVFPIVKKYGGVPICLTLDENGIPDTVEGRVKIAERIAAEAKRYGIRKEDLLFDALTVAVSAQSDAAKICLGTVAALKKLGFKTVLGVSNVSYGLPDRERLNAAFLTLALANGLDAAIMDPTSDAMAVAFRSALALGGKKSDVDEYVSFVSERSKESITHRSFKSGESVSLKEAITSGLKERCREITRELLKEGDALDIVNGEIMPALDEVGLGFENKTIYLPQLLMSAECAKAAFDIIKAAMPRSDKSEKKTKIVIATVKGDVHDIGKNIVRLLLENYGFKVVDLGKDVGDEVILNAVKKERADILGLSALMTTTAAKMKETVSLVRKEAGWCKIMVGGAVVTEEYARSIGADHYAKDALSSVRFAESVEKTKK